MKLSNGALLAFFASLSTQQGVSALAPSKMPLSSRTVNARSQLKVMAAPVEDTVTEGSTDDVGPLDFDTISSLSFRELQRECKARGLPAMGNTGTLRGYLRSIVESTNESTDTGSEGAKQGLSEEEMCAIDISFCDESDPDFDFKDTLRQVMEKSEVGHWKAATRKLKKLSRKYASPEKPVPLEAYDQTLRACVDQRLHGARASEPARKILEEMADGGYEIPADLANTAVQNCLGDGPNGTHDGCGGIDTALAMLSAVESSPNGGEKLTVETYGKVVSALTKDGAVDEALLLLRAMVVEHSFTPPLQTFAEVAKAAAIDDSMAEKVLNVLAYVKAAGYELDKIASVEDGRQILASGVIAAEKLDNLALGLRLLTAAASAEGCAPDRGDDLVASSSSAAQRACTLIHRRAINRAVQDSSWKLAVKLLTLMQERSLTPSPAVWRSVVTCCAKSEKSRKATALLLDWVKLARKGETEKPKISIFNTVINACEICGEEELTLLALEAMKKTHETEGNIITLNIALKRLAKQHNSLACEGLIIGMLQSGIEPNVVSYTTAMAACASEPKDPKKAYEWLQRMRSRNVKPNFHSYNTALASCLDGKLESTQLASLIATEMYVDVERELTEGIKGSADLKSVLPDTYTKVLSRELMKQLRENWRSGDIDMKLAKTTTRVPLLKLVDFEKSEVMKEFKQKADEIKSSQSAEEEDEVESTLQDEDDLEYSVAKSVHKVAEV
mmetsp:Transcript_2993/g.4268  ORF Transcript_2993/g.4268 Transcript_2993/m.4268 type:complete len:731 (-) Transcript_2993:96-2288(-)